MLYKFQSQATESFVMMESNARALLDIIGKSSSKGIITVEQMPAAISALESAIGSDSDSNRHNHDAYAAEDHAEDAERQHVGLHQRAAPLLNMLKRSLAAGKDVVWGV
ncbi:DUF1840 domain-containing protein [Variovorax dokdonensis]|uniref:DUF1840 domain-containing protein n=1 Tax=Variovorax dokdonensis TaxID=344883 RepID=A0ABT7NGF9_9BURK|nr:DUF1840 domain-containing protein [Variovorax dokdonensis]MDM0047024.1 DUF1840 domain-containing protein [Variovorax dokdonensis]